MFAFDRGEITMGKFDEEEQNKVVQDWIKQIDSNQDGKNKKAKRIAIANIAIVAVVLFIILASIWIFGAPGSDENGKQQSVVSNSEQSESTEGISDQSMTESTQSASETQDSESTQNTQKAETTKAQHDAKIICIDAGHQSHADNTKEPNGPGSSDMKARVTGGTQGTTTGVYEYELNLDIALQLQKELEKRGYTICMTRTTHDVNLSNMERAQYATSENADICIRIHANGADISTASGAMALVPSTTNSYVRDLAPESQRLGQCVLDSYCKATGMRNRGVTASDSMTGINWCTMPVAILEMGYMTNPSDDANMEDDAFQMKMVQGIADGVDAYFQ